MIKTKSRIINLEKTKDIFPQIISSLWKGHNKRSDAKQLIKLWPKLTYVVKENHNSMRRIFTLK